LAIASADSSMTTHIVLAFRMLAASAKVFGRYPSCGSAPGTERVPSGGNRHCVAMTAACAAVSTCGTMIPIAPFDSTRLMTAAPWSGTRTRGSTPA
jgi:hypothetical protein